MCEVVYSALAMKWAILKWRWIALAILVGGIASFGAVQYLFRGNLWTSVSLSVLGALVGAVGVAINQVLDLIKKLREEQNAPIQTDKLNLEVEKLQLEIDKLRREAETSKIEKPVDTKTAQAIEVGHVEDEVLTNESVVIDVDISEDEEYAQKVNAIIEIARLLDVDLNDLI